MNEPTDPAPARSPVAMEVEAGRQYQWCRCGRSGCQPWCDGSHAGTAVGPLPWTARRSGIEWFCCCKRTRTAPLCDGSHAKQGVQG